MPIFQCEKQFHIIHSSSKVLDRLDITTVVKASTTLVNGVQKCHNIDTCVTIIIFENEFHKLLGKSPLHGIQQAIEK